MKKLITNCYQGYRRPLRYPDAAVTAFEDPLIIGSVFQVSSLVLIFLGAGITGKVSQKSVELKGKEIK